MKQNKPVIGVTGGVGAGKSTVLQYLKEKFGVTVIMADEVGRELMTPGGRVYRALVENYGSVILKPDDAIDTVVLASIAFKDAESQKRINAIEHPIIKEEIIARIADAVKDEKCCAVVVEAALLKEGGLTELCDEVWYVYTKPEIRIERLKASRGYSEEKCRSILKRQLSDRAFREIADRVIDNSKEAEKTQARLDREMKRILKGQGNL